MRANGLALNNRKIYAEFSKNILSCEMIYGIFKSPEGAVR